MFTCVMLAGTLFMTDGVTASAIGPNTEMRIEDDKIFVSVAGQREYYLIPDEMMSMSLTPIVQGCALAAMAQAEELAAPSSYVPGPGEKPI